ncbi:hypothetical protein ACFLZA_01385 [Candidatus Neomarinimicrobiota bacterium]
MNIEFLEGIQKLRLHLEQIKVWNSLITGDVAPTFKADYSEIPLNKSYTDDFYEDIVDEYY